MTFLLKGWPGCWIHQRWCSRERCHHLHLFCPHRSFERSRTVFAVTHYVTERIFNTSGQHYCACISHFYL